jgi:hypothetical protein
MIEMIMPRVIVNGLEKASLPNAAIIGFLRRLWRHQHGIKVKIKIQSLLVLRKIRTKSNIVIGTM